MSARDITPARASHIAVVDDDVSVRNGLDRLIRSLGHGVRSFGTVDEFLRSGSLETTQCLILDIQMPGLSGLDLQNILHALKVPFPIIFITGFSDENVRARALQMGALGFLEKPFEEQKLIDLLDQALPPTGIPARKN